MYNVHILKSVICGKRVQVWVRLYSLMLLQPIGNIIMQQTCRRRHIGIRCHRGAYKRVAPFSVVRLGRCHLIWLLSRAKGVLRWRIRCNERLGIETILLKLSRLINLVVPCQLHHARVVGDHETTKEGVTHAVGSCQITHITERATFHTKTKGPRQ